MFILLMLIHQQTGFGLTVSEEDKILKQTLVVLQFKEWRKHIIIGKAFKRPRFADNSKIHLKIKQNRPGCNFLRMIPLFHNSVYVYPLPKVKPEENCLNPRILALTHSVAVYKNPISQKLWRLELTNTLNPGITFYNLHLHSHHKTDFIYV